MSEVWTNWEGQVVDGFPLRRCLGVSDHSGVFLTEDPARQLATAAVKLVPLIPTLAESQLAHWNAAASLTHPRLIRLTAMGHCQLGNLHCLYVVMEYAEQNLAHFLAQRALTDLEVREMLPAIFDTLGFLHSRQLVQGQLKPSNILVVGDQLKLASDTIRPAGEAATSISMLSVYDPPEARDGSFSTAGDIWALGVTLFEALTRTLPEKPDERRHGVVLPPDFPPGCADMIRECLSRRPVDRPTVASLQAWVNGVFQKPVASNAGSTPDPMAVRAREEPRGGGRSDLAGRPGVGAPEPAAHGSVAGVASGEVAGPASARVAGTGYAGLAGATSSGEGANATALAGASLQQSATAGPGLAAAGATPDAGGRLTIRAVVEREPTPQEAPRRPLLPFALAAIAVLAVGWLGLHFFRSHSNAPASPAAKTPSAAIQQPDIAPSPNTNTSSPNRNTTDSARSASAARPPEARRSASTTAAAVVHEEIPKVPHSALATIHGHIKVGVRVTVDASGAVVNETLAEPGPSRYFARIASQAARKWKFTPSADNASRKWLVRFEFSRGGTTAHASQRS